MEDQFRTRRHKRMFRAILLEGAYGRFCAPDLLLYDGHQPIVIEPIEWPPTLRRLGAHLRNWFLMMPVASKKPAQL